MSGPLLELGFYVQAGRNCDPLEVLLEAVERSGAMPTGRTILVRAEHARGRSFRSIWDDEVVESQLSRDDMSHAFGDPNVRLVSLDISARGDGRAVGGVDLDKAQITRTAVRAEALPLEAHPVAVTAVAPWAEKRNRKQWPTDSLKHG